MDGLGTALVSIYGICCVGIGLIAVRLWSVIDWSRNSRVAMLALSLFRIGVVGLGISGLYWADTMPVGDVP